MDFPHRERPASMHRDKGAAVAGGPGSLVSGAKSKRHSWSFINVSRAHDPSAQKRGREQASLVVPKHAFNFRNRSSTSASSSAPQTRASSPEPQPQPRPHSSRGPPLSLQVPNFSKTLPTRPGNRGLPTILESKGNTASMESLRSRVDGSKVKRWEGATRTTSPWNGIRRVSLNDEDMGWNCSLMISINCRMRSFSTREAIVLSISTQKVNHNAGLRYAYLST
jgi:hypothetical protein